MTTSRAARRMFQVSRKGGVVFLSVCLLLPMAAPAGAQESQEASGDGQADLAKTIQNPLASLITLPLQANFNDGVGEYDRRFFNLNIQPVIPIPGEKWNVITRTIIPVNSVPVGETDSVFGLGDTQFSLFFSPAEARSLTWGIGPQLNLPTASNEEALGSGKLSAGPAAVIFYGVGSWTMGFVASNVWSVAGDSDRDDVDLFFVQWFLNLNFGGGWAMGTAPVITCDWEYDPPPGTDRCTIPLGLQVSKLTMFGKRPVNLLLGYYDNVQQPVGAAESQVRFQINFLFPQ